MLAQLSIRNFALIEALTLEFERGLNVLTGETGAGKTVLAHALDLLLGGKPRPGIVRPGAAEAYVEGVFEVPPALRAELRDRLPEDAEDLVLARRVSAEGRTRAYVGGRSATAADLRDIGGALLSFYGQHEHRKLTLASAQLDVLDAFCGDAHLRARGEYAACHARALALRRELEELRALAGVDMELEVLRYDQGRAEADMALFDTLGSVLRELDPDARPVPLLMPAVSDGRHFARLGIQTYGFLPMKLPAEMRFMELIHAEDERIPVESLEFGATAIRRLLERS